MSQADDTDPFGQIEQGESRPRQKRPAAAKDEAPPNLGDMMEVYAPGHESDGPILFRKGASPQEIRTTMIKAYPELRTAGEKWKREAGLKAKQLIQGGLYLPMAAADLAMGIPNVVKAGVNLAAGRDPGLGLHELPSQSFQRTLNDIFPEEETPSEKFYGAITSSLGGMASGLKAATTLAAGAPGIAQRVGQQAAQSPGVQAAAAVTGGAASEGGRATAESAGGGPWAQSLSSLAGGLAGGAVPSALPAGAAAVTRGTLRAGGNDAAQTAKNAAEFQQAGTEASAGQATESPVSRTAESFLSKYPGSADVMYKRGLRQQQEIGAQAEAVADQLVGQKGTPYDAGLTLTKGITGPGGWVDRFQAGQRHLYAKAQSFVPPDTLGDVTNFQDQLNKLTTPIKGGEALTKRGISKELLNMRDDLEDDLLANSGQTTAGTVLTSGQYSGWTITPQGKLVPTGGAQGGTPTGQISMQALARLRSDIGDRLSKPELVAGDRPTKQLKLLYGALTRDMEFMSLEADVNSGSVSGPLPAQLLARQKAGITTTRDEMEAAQAQAGPATRAIDRATKFTAAGHQRLEDVLNKVVNSGLPEQVYENAMNKTDMSRGASKIAAVYHSLEPDEQKMLTAAFVRRMGRSKQQGPGDEQVFSTETYLTNYGNMSPLAKKIVFGSRGDQFIEDTNVIARVAQNIREGSKVFSNPSGTAPTAALIGGVTAAVTSAATGHWSGVAGVLLTAGAARYAAYKMTNPKFVSWLAKSTDLNPAAVPAALNQLAQTMAHESPEAVKATDDYISEVGDKMRVLAALEEKGSKDTNRHTYLLKESLKH